MEDHSSIEMEPLTVLIVGAGIGGLSAAIFLRRQGHKVLVFERSGFAAEVGAAIHVAPNCQRLLTRLGLSMIDHGGTPLERFTMYADTGERVTTMPLTEIVKKAGAGWDLIRRADLHSALRNLALSSEGAGLPVQLFLNSGLIGMDVDKATLTLADGRLFTGDLVLGADGVHSWTRSFVAPESQPPFPWGKSCFRWLIPYKKLENELPSDDRNTSYEWTGPDRRIIGYPCLNHSMANFGAFVPTAEVTSSDREWNNRASKEELLRCFESFDPSIRRILNLAPQNELKIWELFDMESLPKWVNGSAALLGDAAHPFLPFMAQGGAMAIEDGASLGALLPLGTTRADVPSRLQLYEKCRKERVERIQDFTRRSGRNNNGIEGPRPNGEETANFVPFCIGHDEWENSSKILVGHIGA